MSRKTRRIVSRPGPRSIRQPAGAGRKPPGFTKLKRQPDKVFVIPGITGPIIPEAEAAAMGLTKFIPAAKSIYKSAKMFGTGGKPLTKGQQAAFDKKQRQMKRTKGEWEYQQRTQTGVERNFGNIPTGTFWSPKLKKKVALTGKGAPGKTKDYPGAQRDWLDTQFIQISGPAEAGAGGMKTKAVKMVKGKPLTLQLWNWGDEIPKVAGKGYFKMTDKVRGMGRFQQSYISARFKPKKGVKYTAEKLPPGKGIQTEYVAWFDQPGVSATAQTGAVTGQTQVRKVVKKGAGTGKAAFKTIGGGSIRQQLDYKGQATGKTLAVLKAGTFAKKQTTTGRYSLSTKKPFTRSARKGSLEGKKTARWVTAENTLLDETKLDKVFAEAVRGGQSFTKTLNLGVWRKLNIKQKSEVLKAAGVV